MPAPSSHSALRRASMKLVAQWLNYMIARSGSWMGIAVVCRVGPCTESCVAILHTPMPIHGFRPMLQIAPSGICGEKRGRWNFASYLSTSHVFFHAMCMCKRNMVGAQAMDQGSSGSVSPNALAVSHRTHMFTLIAFSNGVRWQAEESIARVTLVPGGVGRASHGAAKAHQM